MNFGYNIENYDTFWGNLLDNLYKDGLIDENGKLIVKVDSK